MDIELAPSVVPQPTRRKADDGRTPPSLLLRAAWCAGLITAAWALSALAHLVGADIILLPLIVIGIGSLLRAGHTLLDRLMFALMLALGGGISLGLLFSVWPWGLNPLPIAGTTLSLLVMVGFALNRRPQLPRRVLASDAIVLAAPLLAIQLLRQPTAGLSFVQALPYITGRDDAFNHYALFDAMRHVGGFTFLHGDASARYLVDENQYIYPPGAHFLYALLDAFRLSSNHPGPAQQEFMRYHQYEILGFAFLCLSVTWAARWIAGPAMTGWRRALICGVVGSTAVFGELSTLFWQGYDGEVFALGVLALMTAVLCRPPHRTREQILAVAALAVAVSFAYGLYMVFVAAGVVIAAVFHRKRLLRHWRFALAVAVVAVPLAAIPFIENKIHTPVTAYTTIPLFIRGGTFWIFSKANSVGFALVAMSGLLTRAGRRSPVWWVLCLLVIVANAAAVYAQWYGVVHVGRPKYYSAKMVEAAWVISLAGFGAIGAFLKPIAKSARSRFGAYRLTELPVGLAAVLVAVTLARGLPLGDAEWKWETAPPRDLSAMDIWSRGYITSGISGPAAAYARSLPVGDGVPTVTVFSDQPEDNKRLIMFLAVLNGDLNQMAIGDFDGRGIEGLATAAPDRTGQLSPQAQTAITQLEAWLQARPVGTRVVVADDAVAKSLRRFAQQHPQMQMTVVPFPKG